MGFSKLDFGNSVASEVLLCEGATGPGRAHCRPRVQPLSSLALGLEAGGSSAHMWRQCHILQRTVAQRVSARPWVGSSAVRQLEASTEELVQQRSIPTFGGLHTAVYRGLATHPGTDHARCDELRAIEHLIGEMQPGPMVCAGSKLHCPSCCGLLIKIAVPSMPAACHLCRCHPQKLWWW